MSLTDNNKNKLTLDAPEEEELIFSTEVVKEFYEEILQSPELYPYFMTLRPNGLWRKCDRMASYFSRVFKKDFITPADTQHLKKIHHDLNITEKSYDMFTKLFAHTCCKGKSDNHRKRMLRLSGLLKAHICGNPDGGKNLKAFLKVISNINNDNRVIGGGQRSTLNTVSASATQTGGLKQLVTQTGGLKQLVNNGSEVFNARAHYFHLRKRLQELERLIGVIRTRCERMEECVAILEAK